MAAATLISLLKLPNLPPKQPQIDAKLPPSNNISLISTSKSPNQLPCKDHSNNPQKLMLNETILHRKSADPQGDDYLLNDDGFAKPSYPNHWKGQNGLYCAGLARRGLYGAALDAQKIAHDIKAQL